VCDLTHLCVYQCVVVCCSVLQVVTVCCSVTPDVRHIGVFLVSQHVAVCCSVSQHVAVCCSVSKHVAVCCSVSQHVAVCCRVSQEVCVTYAPLVSQLHRVHRVALCCIGLQRVQNALQCVVVCHRRCASHKHTPPIAVCCSVLQLV